jgi:hypothetical protein
MRGGAILLNRIKAGTVAGLAAGLAVAVMILVYDLVMLEPLATPRLLAGSVFGTPIELDTGLGMVAWVTGILQAAWALTAYTVAHFAVFAVVGVGAAYVFQLGLLPGNVITGALYGGFAGSAVFYSGVALVAPEFIAAPDWRLVVLTNALAGIVLVSQLLDHAELETEPAV